MARKIAFIGKIKPKRRNSFWATKRVPKNVKINFRKNGKRTSFTDIKRIPKKVKVSFWATKSWKLKNGRIVKETFRKNDDDQLSIWLSLEHLFKAVASLNRRIKNMEEKMAKALKFYDLKKRKSFKSAKYKVVKKGKRKFAVAKSPSGTTAWRAIKK